MVISACIACVCVSHFLGFTKPNNLLNPKPQILNSKPYTAHPPVQIGPKSWQRRVQGFRGFGVNMFWGLGCWIWGIGFCVQSFWIWGLGFRDFGFGAQRWLGML